EIVATRIGSSCTPSRELQPTSATPQSVPKVQIAPIGTGLGERDEPTRNEGVPSEHVRGGLQALRSPCSGRTHDGPFLPFGPRPRLLAASSAGCGGARPARPSGAASRRASPKVPTEIARRGGGGWFVRRARVRLRGQGRVHKLLGGGHEPVAIEPLVVETRVH